MEAREGWRNRCRTANVSVLHMPFGGRASARLAYPPFVGAQCATEYPRVVHYLFLGCGETLTAQRGPFLLSHSLDSPQSANSFSTA